MIAAIEAEVRLAVYKVKTALLNSLTWDRKVSEKEKWDAVQLFIKSRGLSSSRDLNEFLQRRTDEEQPQEPPLERTVTPAPEEDNALTVGLPTTSILSLGVVTVFANAETIRACCEHPQC